MLAIFVTGCSGGGGTVEQGGIGYIEGFLGGVSADEPRAALVGREILSSGGSAADAAVAMYFTLSVTMPSSASLGGGGVCVVHDAESGNTEALNFLARIPRVIPQTASRPSAIPGNPRGFYALFAKYGSGILRWEQLVSPAVNLAREGTPISRALSRDLAVAHDALIADPAFVAVFGGETLGRLINEGGNLKQIDLSTILRVISTQGPADFYNGKAAVHLVDAVERAGGSLTLDDLREYRPYWQETQKVSVGEHTAHFSPPPAAAGTVAATMLDILVNRGLYLDADGDVERLHVLAEVAMLSYADRSRWMLPAGETRWSSQELSDMTRLEEDLQNFSLGAHMPAAGLSIMPVRHSENPSGTSFVTVDKNGGAVACSLTMNNLFGTGRVAPGTGIILATIPDGKNRGPYSLGPMIMDNQNSKKFFWAGASSGGVAAPTSLINVASQVLIGNSSLSSAIAAKRIHHDAFPDTTYYEKGLEQWIVDGLVNRGHSVVPVSTMGRVNAIYCFKGLPDNPDTCEIANDPRAFGLATMSQ